MAVIVTIAVIGLLTFWLERKVRSYNYRQVNNYLALVILLNAVVWDFAEILSEGFSIANDLPVHICGITPYLLAAYLWRPQQPLFDILYYWIIAGVGMALMIPDLHSGFPSFEFFRFFFSHGLPLFGMLLLIYVQGVRPSPRSYVRSLITLNLYAFFIAGPINLLTGGNYLYLRGAPRVDFSPIELLPAWPWHIPLIEIFAIALFLISYSPFYIKTRYEADPDLLAPKKTPPH